MFKETPKSLRLYFAVLAVISLLPMATTVFSGQFSDLVSWSTLVDFTATMILVHISIRFEQLLRTPTVIKVWLIAGMGTAVSRLVISLGGEHMLIAGGAVVLSALLFVYLMKSVTRLSREKYSPLD